MSKAKEEAKPEPTIHEQHSQADLLVAQLEAQAQQLQQRLQNAYEHRERMRQQVLEAKAEA